MFILIFGIGETLKIAIILKSDVVFPFAIATVEGYGTSRGHTWKSAAATAACRPWDAVFAGFSFRPSVPSITDGP